MAFPVGNTSYPPGPGLSVKPPEFPSISSNSLPTIQDRIKAEQQPLTREISRTPSPTPSEVRALTVDGKGRIKEFFNVQNWRRYIWYWVAIVIGVTLTILLSVFHEKIVRWLHPAAVWLHDDAKVGWLVPIAILIVISFPPLFGHEIVAALCGLVWGPWIGFGIVAAGTFLGEIANYYTFRYLCKARAEKIERKKIFYACLARVIRDGGFWIALIARYSAIPAHFTTAIFATCGMGIVVFAAAAFLSLPKQFANVYLGVLMADSANGSNSNKNRLVTGIVLTITILVTIFAMRHILLKIKEVKPRVVYERRKERQRKLVTGSSKESNYKVVGSVANAYKVALPPLRPSGYRQLDPHAEDLDDRFDHHLIAPKPYTPQPFPPHDPQQVLHHGYYDPYERYSREDIELGAAVPISNRGSSHINPKEPPGLPAHREGS